LRHEVGLNSPLVYAGVLPKLTGDLDRVDAGLLPPGFLVAGAMNRTVMRAAQWDDEFIARLAAERARLHKSDVVRVRRLAAAQEARLLGHQTKMVPVAIAAWRVRSSCIAIYRFSIDDEPMAQRGKSRFDSVEFGAIAGIKDTARLALGYPKSLGKRDLADPGFAPSTINGDFRRQSCRQRHETLSLARLRRSWKISFILDPTSDRDFKRIRRHVERLRFGHACG
jgi:hypothetical protein